jgi:predicted metal-dependent hydrolase
MRLRKKAAIRPGNDLSIQWQDQLIHCRTRYSPNRRTLQIAVKAPGEVVITAPAGQSERALLAFANSKAGWIARKLEQVRTRTACQPVADLAEGGELSFLGQPYRLAFNADERLRTPEINLDTAAGLIRYRGKTQDPEYLRRGLTLWYRSQAAALVAERAALHARRLGVVPLSVRVKEQKRRWGSCTAAGNVLINWRCVLAPLPILDYVVLHELCHLKQLNHSARFWSEVKATMPDYAARRRWLKDNGDRLTF